MPAVAGHREVADGGAGAPRLNVIVVMTDDQTADSIPHEPPVMPFLQERLEDPEDDWVRFSNAFLSSPMCCPSRATLLTGRYASRLGVRSNRDGARFDDAPTVASWLDLAGYETAYVGKYLNGYPFGRGAYVPPGWDRWVGKLQGDGESVYHDYELIVDGAIERHGSAPVDYLTDVLARHATGFLRTAPHDRPFLLWFAPTAPHPPWIPASRHEGRFADLPVPAPPDAVEGSPSWVRALPEPDAGTVDGWTDALRRHHETLLAVDEAIEAILLAVEERGELDRTVVFVLTDNGYAFGEQRWLGKACPYDACTRTPFLARFPGQSPGEDEGLVSSIDLAPTIAEIAGARAPAADGVSLLAPARDGLRAPPGREGILLEWVGGNGVPAWAGVRTRDALYVEYAAGERELYRDGLPSPNLAGRPEAAADEVRLTELLARLLAF